MSGLPAHIEKVHREDLTLSVLYTILEQDLAGLPEGSRLSAIVVDFKIDVALSASQTCSQLDRILKLLATHPSGGVIRFGQVHMFPKAVRLPSMKDRRIPPPLQNHFQLFNNINNHLCKRMGIYGIGSAFGSYRRNNPGIRNSLASWHAENWEGSIAGIPESLLNCERLTPEACALRSVSLLRSIELELSTMSGL